eukprot:jgi/Botrbrau1/17263/Bobra.0015s0022.1
MEGPIFDAKGCLPLLTGQLQMFRDNEGIFMLEVQLLMRLVGDPDRLSWVKGQPGPLRQIQAVYQLLSRNLDFEQKYLERLEGQKGSDVSAREATKRVVTVTRQLSALKCLMEKLNMEPVQNEPSTPHGEEVIPPSHPLQNFQNTLVREALQDLTGAARNRQPSAATTKGLRRMDQ